MSETTKPAGKSDHIYGLDGLRALAIIGVTLFHMFPGTFKGGYLGTSLFFVLTGYLLAKTSDKKMEAGTFSVGEYYLKRLKRIYPALIIVLLVTSGVYYIFIREALGGTRPELLSIIFGYNNWWQIAGNADYFTKISNASAFTHLWFLAIEVQFYLIWPIILIIYSFLSDEKESPLGLVFLMILTITSAALTPIMYHPGDDVTRLYYGSDTRAYALLFGTFLGMAENERRLIRFKKGVARTLGPILFVTMLAITIVAYFLLDGQLPFTYLGGMLGMTLVFALMLLTVTDKRTHIGKLLEAKPIAWIGKISYEMYLWQYPVIYFFLYKGLNDKLPGSYLIEAAAIVILAAILHYVVEAIMKKKFNVGNAIAIVATCLVMIVGCVGIFTAPKERPGNMDELAKLLEENQKKLQELEENKKNGTDETEEADTETAEGETGETEEGASEETTETEETKEQPAPEFEYAASDLTNSAEVSKERVLMIGDSIMLGASEDLLNELPGATIDAVQNRMVVSAIEVGKEHIANGDLNKTVVISLGTNGRITKDTARKIMDTFGPDTSVFWVNLFGRTVLWRDEANQNLIDISQEYPNLTVIDWCSLIKDHPEWLWQDGEHPNVEGAKIFAQLVRESIESAQYNQQQ